MDELPCEAACWLTSAIKPAHKGEAQLVPPTDPTEVPFLEMRNTPSAGMDTSG